MWILFLAELDKHNMNYLITGAASGIGLATAKLLAGRITEPGGLLLTDVDRDKLNEAAHRLTRADLKIVTCVADLAQLEAAAQIAELAQREFGELDGVVSNAGVVHGGRLNDLPIEEYERVFNVNTRAGWLIAKASHPLLRSVKGAFVAVASIVSCHPLAGGGAYAASKAALVMLVKQLALEWAGDRIRCNCVSPGTILTGMTQAALIDPAVHESRARRVPSERIGTAEDIAGAIAFLLGPESSYINGANLLVDGGLNISLFYGATPAI